MNDLISLSKEITPGTYDSDFAGAPEILVLSPSGGYVNYYFISDATDDDDTPLGYNCWADMDGYELKDADKLTLGKGFWFKSEVAGSINVAGEVSAKASDIVAFPAGAYHIVGNPYPKAVSFAEMVTTGITPGTYASDFAGAPEILVQGPTGGYVNYYYISDATDEDDVEVGYNCWADMDGYILEGSQVDVGASFWIKAATAGTLGFSL